MIYVIVNALLYIFLLLFYMFSREKNILGVILIALYTIVAIFAIPRYYLSIELLHDVDDITLEPFIYLFIVFIMFVRYFVKVDIRTLTNIYAKGRWKKMYFLIYVYILSTVVVFYLSINDVISNIYSGEWGDIKKASSELDVAFNYHFFLEQILVVFNSQSTVFMSVICFFMLTNNRSKSLLYILLFCMFFSISLLSLKGGGRGVFVIFFISIITPYLLFKKNLPYKTIKLINKILFSSIFIATVYFFTVTVSRFGDFDTSYNIYETYNGLTSLLSYMGQSFLFWNVGVYPISEYGYGIYGCEFLYGNDAFMNFTLGTRWITKFYTFVGSIYVDVGPYITFFIALIVFIYSFILLNIKRYNIEDVCFFTYVYVKLFIGVFSWTDNYVIDYIICFIIYLFLKIKISICVKK